MIKRASSVYAASPLNFTCAELGYNYNVNLGGEPIPNIGVMSFATFIYQTPSNATVTESLVRVCRFAVEFYIHFDNAVVRDIFAVGVNSVYVVIAVSVIGGRCNCLRNALAQSRKHGACAQYHVLYQQRNNRNRFRYLASLSASAFIGVPPHAC